MNLLMENLIQIPEENNNFLSRNKHMNMTQPTTKSGVPLFVYLLTWDHTNRTTIWYDYYEKAIVIAKNEKEAVTIHPEGEVWIYDKTINKWLINPNHEDSWSAHEHNWARNPIEITATRIGIADSSQRIGVVLASFISL
jgi:hypothetical protein